MEVPRCWCGDDATAAAGREDGGPWELGKARGRALPLVSREQRSLASPELAQ